MQAGNINSSDLFRLQSLVFGNTEELDTIRKLYYKSDISVVSDGEKKRLPAGCGYDFFTYFNAFSIEKWAKYTIIKNLYIVLDIKGAFSIELTGYYLKNKELQKETLGVYSFDCDGEEKIILKFPEGSESTLLGFFISAGSDVVIKDAYYASDIDTQEIKNPFISMITTTFKKEEYVKRNIDLLDKELFNDDRYKDCFSWSIVDNGRTLEAGDIERDNIRLYHNKNTGGAGGFARGMIEALNQKKQPTHILLMDDDVVFVPESFKRLHTFLSVIKGEYSDCFISGAMLKLGHPNIQHEDIGLLNTEGYHQALKPDYDLNKKKDIVKNEVIRDSSGHQYGAWWFCCIPASVAGRDNLPVPFFFRGDDVEYSLRNNARLISMNGICIWHEEFEGKFSAALEYYQVNRNELILRAMHPELYDVDCIGHMKTIFWEEVYKFNYKGANLILDAVEDYMKGPDYIFGLDGEKVMKEKKEADNITKPLPSGLSKGISKKKLLKYVPVKSRIKYIYDYTYNGQARIPERLLNKRTGIILYGWGYNPGRMVLTDKNIAVDPVNNTYTVYKKSRKSFNAVKSRFERLMSLYDREHTEIEAMYTEKAKEVTKEEFWKKYLCIE